MDHYQHTIQTWDQLADLYQDKFMDLDLYDDTYDIFCDLIPSPNARLFEIACGPGNITRYMHRKRPDLVIEATDVSPNMIQLAKENVPEASFSVMDCRDIGKLQPGFDAILCGFCMPYLSKNDALQFIKDSAHLLNSGGVFYCSIIEDKYDNSTFETSSNGQFTMFIYYHEAGYLQKALEENNMQVLHLIRKQYPKKDGSSQVNLIIIAKKN
ncbi:class I SAM-dependent methyltransferase [Ferruginibacter sp.]